MRSLADLSVIERTELLKTDVDRWNELRADPGETPIDLRKVHLVHADLMGVDLSDTILDGALLESANMRFALLRRSCLRRGVLRHADLGWADLREADLRNADLTDADLSNADLRGADLRGAVLCRANLAGSRVDSSVRLGEAQVQAAEVSPEFLTLLGGELSESQVHGLEVKRETAASRRSRAGLERALFVFSLLLFLAPYAHATAFGEGPLLERLLRVSGGLGPGSTALLTFLILYPLLRLVLVFGSRSLAGRDRPVSAGTKVEAASQRAKTRLRGALDLCNYLYLGAALLHTILLL